MWQFLLGGAGILGGVAAGKEFIVDPIRRQHFPDTQLLKNELLNREQNAQGGYDLSEDDLYRYQRSGLDDLVTKKYGSAEFLERYIRDEQAARRTRKRKQELADRDLDPDVIAARNHQKLLNADLLAQQQHRRAEETSRRLQEAQLAEYRNQQLLRADQNTLFNLQTQRQTAAKDHALALEKLLSSKDENAWRQQMYQQQLEYDREDRRRDQGRFYALAGTTALTEALKALF